MNSLSIPTRIAITPNPDPPLVTTSSIPGVRSLESPETGCA